MDKYLHITKPLAPNQKRKHVEKDPHLRDREAMKKMTEKERIMHIATTATTSGHDIWQSASTGHQVTEAGGKSVSYNDARLAKLQAQFPPQRPVKRLRTAEDEITGSATVDGVKGRDSSHISLFDYDASSNLYHPSPVAASQTFRNVGAGIFGGCVFYLDGYMGPKMSDHSLRRILTQNGGALSMYLKKTRITHVLLSDTGALANSKIRKEVEGSRNRVKFVKVEWVHKCLEAGKRIGEWEYSVDRLCGRNQTVASMMNGNATTKDKLKTIEPEEDEFGPIDDLVSIEIPDSPSHKIFEQQQKDAEKVDSDHEYGDFDDQAAIDLLDSPDKLPKTGTAASDTYATQTVKSQNEDDDYGQFDEDAIDLIPCSTSSKTLEQDCLAAILKEKQEADLLDAEEGERLDALDR